MDFLARSLTPHVAQGSGVVRTALCCDSGRGEIHVRRQVIPPFLIAWALLGAGSWGQNGWNLVVLMTQGTRAGPGQQLQDEGAIWASLFPLLSSPL